jgi:predicted transposase YbfD/YdcC
LKKIKVQLENCYGIRALKQDFDFSKKPAYAIYAPNGVMKSSFAQTFKDVANGAVSSDRIFPRRKTVRQILDESGKDIGKDNVLVVFPYDPLFGITEKTSTLLIEPKLREAYEQLIRETVAAKKALLDAVKKSAQTKRDMGAELANAFTPDGDFDKALLRVEREVREQADAPFATVEYDILFNDKVETALGLGDLKAAIEDYVRRYNELLAKSAYFRKGTFDYYNAGQIAKSLTDNGFFSAKHSVNLRAQAGSREITTKEELEAVIAEDKRAILTDQALRTKFDTVSKQLEKNAELRKFCGYLQNNEPLLARMNNPGLLREEILKSYLKANEVLYLDWVAKVNAAADRRRELEEQAKGTSAQWDQVIDIFNDRFFVPFTLSAKNRTEVMLGHAAIIDLAFTYADGAETAQVEKDALLRALSTGERKALYILNVIFEIETRKKNKTETLVVVDDIADSFDYQNKYAIIQYLKDISEEGIFKMIVMTHNFDFFRTLESRFIDYNYCLMATKGDAGPILSKAAGIKNVFARDWKPNFFKDERKKVASIPFLRNLIEMTTGEADPDYVRLTGMLHWKPGVTDAIKAADLDTIYNALCKTKETSADPARPIVDLIMEQADGCMKAGAVTLGLENKIVLAVGIRLKAERFMIARIADPAFVAAIHDNQTQELVKEFKKRFAKDPASKVLDQVALMTPENIHVNSFMYEPIVDMSDSHLRKLYERVSGLQ